MIVELPPVPMDITCHSKSTYHQFNTLQQLNGPGGANNTGIFLVENVSTGQKCVEKRNHPADVACGYAQREIDILLQLSSHPNIIQLVDYELTDDFGVPEDQLTAKTYTEFCEYATLQHLSYSLRENDERLHESKLWHILKGLTEAVRYLQQGPKEFPFLSWNPVYHRDIHLGNVFLASDPADPSKPRVVLGDFGLSTTVAPTRLGYNQEWIISEFERCAAPPEFPLYSPKSDIYQIGALIYCLMNRQLIPYDGMAPRFVKGQKPTLEHDVRKREAEEYEEPYSEDLVNVVNACLRGNVSCRCDINQLLVMIEKSGW